MTAPQVRIALPCVFESGTFARYRPFADDRHVVARRGRELGFDYGLEQGRRRAGRPGAEVELVAYRYLLTCAAGEEHCEVLRAPGVEILIPRGERGFTDAEVERILTAITGAGAPADRP